jgi:preprotein translocase subunit YajC
MITIHPDSLLLAPAVMAVCFMLWFLVMLWRDEHRRRKR